MLSEGVWRVRVCGDKCVWKVRVCGDEGGEVRCVEMNMSVCEDEGVWRST